MEMEEGPDEKLADDMDDFQKGDSDEQDKESDDTPEKQLISKFGQNTSVNKEWENFYSYFKMSEG